MEKTSAGTTGTGHTNQRKRKRKDGPGPIRTPGHLKKLDPPRPFPTVQPGVSATGPRSAHHEGKNYFTITRKTNLGSYLRRCKDVVVKDGYKSLHLCALGAAIPHLCRLVESLPEVLPFSPEEIRKEILTGTVDVQDELLPEDEEEDITYRTRAKSSLSVVIIIGDGIDESIAGGGKWGSRGKRRKRGALATSRTEGGAGDGCDAQERGTGSDLDES